MKLFPKILTSFLATCLVFGSFAVLPVHAETAAMSITIPPVAVTFNQMGFEGQTFDGPYEMAGFSFFLPDEWRVESGSSIRLKYTVRMPVSEKDKALATGGYSYLYVHMNYTQLAYIPLKASGDFEINIPISLWVAPPLPNGSNEIEFVFKNDNACKYDNGISVYIKPESTVNIKPFQQPTAPRLNTLPRPFFYENNVITGFHTTMVVPEKPTAGELQAALAVAASLGSMADNTADLSLVSEKALTDSIKKNDHLIFVGKSLSLPVLRDLNLLTPLDPYTGFLSPTIDKNDGVIQFNNSPWNPARVSLIISGETDEAVVKAGQSIRTKVVTQLGYYGLAVVKQLPVAAAQSTPTPGPTLNIYEKTFMDLGYNDSSVAGIGSFTLDYYFTFPGKHTVGKDAYVDFIITPSAGLNLAESLIYVYLNDNPIGRISLTKTAQNTQSKQSERVEIPAAGLRSGKNHIALTMNMSADDRCDNSINEFGNLKKQLWTMTVHADSLIHVPFGTGLPGDEDISTSAGLGRYGEELASVPSLDNLAFILPPDDAAAWEAAARVAFRLGNRGKLFKIEKGPVLLHVFFTGDDLSGAAGYDIVTAVKDENIGMSVVAATRNLDDDPTIKAYDSPVTYHMLPGVSVGKAELTESTWNAERRMLALSGNDDGGLKLAADAIMLSKYEGFLIGSSVMTNGVQVVFDKP